MKINLKIPSAVFCALATSSVFAATITETVLGTSDLWLAGMPNGTTASSGDVAPSQSPAEMFDLQVFPGQFLFFSASGKVGNSATATRFGAEGDTSRVVVHREGAENGISSCRAPINALMGVFLGPGLPSLTPAPGTLDFEAQTGRDYTSLSPALKQVFFIGDGLTSTGSTQTIKVPSGATRLFLGSMDGFSWFDNAGAFVVTVTPVPNLSIRAIESSRQSISWPTNLPGFSLEYTRTLPAFVWFPATNAVVVEGGQFVVTMSGVFQRQFFRLRKP